jgi:hypothetical protein
MLLGRGWNLATVSSTVWQRVMHPWCIVRKFGGMLTGPRHCHYKLGMRGLLQSKSYSSDTCCQVELVGGCTAGSIWQQRTF